MNWLETTVICSGTSWTFSNRFWAVTTTSGSTGTERVSPPSCPPTAWARALCETMRAPSAQDATIKVRRRFDKAIA